MNYYLAMCLVTTCGLIQAQDARVGEEFKKFASVMAAKFEIPKDTVIDIQPVTLSFFNKPGELTVFTDITSQKEHLAGVIVFGERNGFFEAQSFLVKDEWLQKNEKDTKQAAEKSLTMKDLVVDNCIIEFTKNGSTYIADPTRCIIPDLSQRATEVNCNYFLLTNSGRNFYYQRMKSYELPKNFEPKTRPCPRDSKQNTN